MGILSLRDVPKIYGELKAFDQINLTAGKGEWIAIMGPSGSGKAIIMNIIGRMDKSSLGEVIPDGTDIVKRSQKELTEVRHDEIGFVPQQLYLANYLTVLENVIMAQYYHSMPDEEEAMEALRKVGLADHAKHLPDQLPGGEQQRACIARALISHPALLPADGPIGNLDEESEYLVMDIFEKPHNAGSSIIVVIHDPKAEDEAERIIVLEHGRIAHEEKKKRQRPVIAE